MNGHGPSAGQMTLNAAAGDSGLPEGNVTRPCERCGRQRKPRQEKYCSFGDGGRSTCAQLAWKEKHPYVTPTHIRQRESGSIWRAIYDLMAAEPGRWWTIQELAEAVGALPNSVSTRVRTEVKRHAQASGFRLLRDHLVGHAGEGHRFSLKREAA